jgi:hypothetical protein
MFILTTLNQLITSTDNYGSIVNFNYFKNSNKHKSFCGGISNVESVDIRELFIPDLK